MILHCPERLKILWTYKSRSLLLQQAWFSELCFLRLLQFVLMWMHFSCFSFCVENLEFHDIFFWNSRGYLKNHWINTRLVCTHVNAFSILISNMSKSKFWKFLKKFQKSDLSSTHDSRKQRVNKLPGGPLVFEVGYHPRKTIHVIRVVFQDQAMYARTSFRGAKTGKIEKRVCFWSDWQILERTWHTK